LASSRTPLWSSWFLKHGPTAIQVFVPRPRLSEGDVREIGINRRDPLWNGTLIGLGAGLGAAALVIASSDRLSSECGVDCPNGRIVLTMGGIGAGMRALLDATINHLVTVYRSPGQQSSAVQVAPFVSKTATGIQLSVRF
jgi:hypothetical protein